MGPVLVQPEDGRGAGRPGPLDGQLDPVLDGDVPHAGHPPDVAGFDLEPQYLHPDGQTWIPIADR